MIEWLMNNELERMWKEAVVARFAAPHWHLPEGIVKNDKELRDSLLLGRHLNTGPISWSGGGNFHLFRRRFFQRVARIKEHCDWCVVSKETNTCSTCTRLLYWLGKISNWDNLKIYYDNLIIVLVRFSHTCMGWNWFSVSYILNNSIKSVFSG
jgi:hypothetical protein